MDFDEESDTYNFVCRCGDLYRISTAQLVQGTDTVPCGGCSFAIRITYEAEEEEDYDTQGDGTVRGDDGLAGRQTTLFSVASGEASGQDSTGSHRGSIQPLAGSVFALLPEEQGLEIFKYLDYQDLCRASCVCKTFLRWASDDSLWRPLYIRHILRRSSVRGVRGIYQSSQVPPVAKNNHESWRFAFRERACKEREAEDIIEARNKQIVLLEMRVREFESEVKNVFDYLEGEKQAQMQTSAMLMKARAELENGYYEINEKNKRLDEKDEQIHQLIGEAEELTATLHEEKKKSALLDKQRDSAQQANKKAEEELELMQQRWASAVQDNFRLKKENMALLKEVTAAGGEAGDATPPAQLREKQAGVVRRKEQHPPSMLERRRHSAVALKGRLPLVAPNTQKKCNF